jgi:DNA topoisomerase-3
MRNGEDKSENPRLPGKAPRAPRQNGLVSKALIYHADFFDRTQVGGDIRRLLRPQAVTRMSRDGGDVDLLRGIPNSRHIWVIGSWGPTEAGLLLFGVLQQADPALVDPGVTAQLECLLDDVVVGRQEMVGAIDAVCDVADRIIGKLKDGAATGGPPLLGAAVGNGPAAYPPTPAMKRFADSLARRGIKPPPGYKTSISICRKFLNEHAPKKAEGETPGKLDSKPVSPAQTLYAKKIAQSKGVITPEEAKANSAAMSAWIDANRSAKRSKRGRRTGSVPPQTATTKRSRKRKADAAAAPHPAASAPAQPNPVTDTPLRIPYGNKEVALKLGARYRSGGW